MFSGENVTRANMTETEIQDNLITDTQCLNHITSEPSNHLQWYKLIKNHTLYHQHFQNDQRNQAWLNYSTLYRSKEAQKIEYQPIPKLNDCV
jgi:hypothetical protein